MMRNLILLIGLLSLPLVAHGQQMEVEFYESNPTVITYSGTSHSPLGVGFYVIPIEESDTPFIGEFGAKLDVRTYANRKRLTPEIELQDTRQGIVVIYGETGGAAVTMQQSEEPEEPTVTERETDSKIRMATAGLTRTLYAQKGTFGKTELRIGTFLETGAAQVKTYETLELSDGSQVTQRQAKDVRPVVGTGVLIGLGSNLAAHVGYNYVEGRGIHDVQFGVGIRF